MVKCSRCKQRLAVIFVTKIENGQKISEGLCIKCAKELGLPIDDMIGDSLEKLGMSADDMDDLEQRMNEMVDSGEIVPSEDEDTPAVGDDGGAPSIDFKKLFGQSDATNSDSKEKAKKSKEKGEKAPKNEFLNQYCKNLTLLASRRKLDRIVGRDTELARVIQILCRRQKNNPCLIGEPGVGKTAIAEALAQRIAEGSVPYALKNKELYLVDMTALISGTQFRGQFEQRMQKLLEEVKRAGNVILVIDEIHNIVGMGNAEGSMNAANILKPALSRGEIQILGATTLNEYRKHIEKDTALERRFQPVTVNEPSLDDASKMLLGIKHYYEDFHNIVIPDALLPKAVLLSERYITDRYLPDKAIDLLDEAAAQKSLSSQPINESHEIRDELIKLKIEREEAEAEIQGDDSKQFEKIANIKVRELSLSDRLKELEEECTRITLTTEDLAEVIEVWTGIPATTISANEFERIDTLDARLRSRIVGQDKAVDAVTRAIKRNRAGISYKRKPVSFIFAGPTGVGKTELVKVLAADLFSTPENLIRLDMSEFMEKHSVSRIIGSPPGYVGYDEAGQLTEKIRRHPYSVVLFDEIEKAHPDVLNVLLQILDDGRITDAQGRTVNFENTVIVMTTNAGSEGAAASVGFTTPSGGLTEQRTEKALLSFLRPEFLNRVDEVIVFRSLDKNDFVSIAHIMLGDLKSVLKDRALEFEYTETAASFIAEKSFSQKYGARNMRRFICREVEDKLADMLIKDYSKLYTHVKLDVINDEISVSCL